MEFPVKTGAPARQRTACAVVPVFEGRPLAGPAREIDLACGGLLKQLLRSGDASAKLGRCLLVPQLQGPGAARALLVGCGKPADFDAKKFRTALTVAARALKEAGLGEAVSYLGAVAPEALSAYYTARLTVETTRAACYQFDELKSKIAGMISGGGV